jgi:hypothetical protein
MTTTVRAVFDGHVFRPDEPVPLEPNARYVLTVEPEGASAEADGSAGQEVYPLSALGALSTDMGVTDLAARHDWHARRGAEADGAGDADGADGADGADANDGAPGDTPER